MGTSIRPEISAKNQYWIPKQRYYELKHFCLQYPSWKEKVRLFNGYSAKSDYIDAALARRGLTDPTERAVEQRDGYSRRISMVEACASLTDETVADYILKCVTEGISYDKMNAREALPCSKDRFYMLYRKFFWLLNDIRE